MSPRSILFLVLAALFVSAPPAAAHDDEPLVIGHRGAPGYLPDHTLEGYALAIRLGADYIEPDLVATKDGHLIARHEPNITATTDVAEHPSSNRAARPGGRRRRRAGLLRFRLHARRDQDPGRAAAAAERPQQFNGRFRIPTFERGDRARQAKSKVGRVGIYPETKHPTYHQEPRPAARGPAGRGA